MGKIRVWYWPNGKISVSYPDTRYQLYIDRQLIDWINKKPEDEDLDEWIAKKPEDLTQDEWTDKQLDNVAIKAPPYSGLDFEDIDISQLPQDRADRDRWRGTKATGIQIDNTVILRQDLEKDIDDELLLINPNMKKIMQLIRKLDKREHS